MEHNREIRKTNRSNHHLVDHPYCSSHAALPRSSFTSVQAIQYGSILVFARNFQEWDVGQLRVAMANTENPLAALKCKPAYRVAFGQRSSRRTLQWT